MRTYDKAYVEKWGAGPHTTVDALVQYGSYVLLIQRKDLTWALPGGFVNPGETLLTAAIRELGEETNIGIPSSELRTRFTGAEVWDDPWRDPRAHIISHVHSFWLDQLQYPKPAVRASDDAIDAKWFDVAGIEFEALPFYADHKQIIQQTIGYVG